MRDFQLVWLGDESLLRAQAELCHHPRQRCQPSAPATSTSNELERAAGN